MIGYHWSPAVNTPSIRKHGLLVPTKHPKLVVPVVCSEGHRNPHISLGRTPLLAWELSGGFLIRRLNEIRGITTLPPEWRWDLWEVNLGNNYQSNGIELQSRKDIGLRAIKYVGGRVI